MGEKGRGWESNAEGHACPAKPGQAWHAHTHCWASQQWHTIDHTFGEFNLKREGVVFPGGMRRVVEFRRQGEGEGVPIALRPLRLGFQRRWAEWGLVAPEAPRRVARDSQGRIVRDERGEAVLVPDEARPEWRAAYERHQLRVAALVVAEGWADEDATFDSSPRDGESGGEYADRLLDELDASGWSAGEVVWLCEQVLALSRLVGDGVREAGERSSPPRPEG